MISISTKANNIGVFYVYDMITRYVGKCITIESNDYNDFKNSNLATSLPKKLVYLMKYGVSTLYVGGLVEAYNDPDVSFRVFVLTWLLKYNHFL